jgi:carboxyl-terminal processing protease
MNKVTRTYVQISPFQLAIALVTVFVVAFLLGNQITMIDAQGNVIPESAQEDFQPIYEVYQSIQQQYVEDVETDTLINGAIDGMVTSLEDQYSAYLSPEAYTQFDISLSGDMEGIGATIQTNEADEVEIINVLPGTPAEAAGVQPGDVFTAVDGQDVTDLDQLELLPLVRGPAGTEVTITFRRGEDLVDITITRDRFEVPTVTSEVLDNNIGYVYMTDFNQRSREQLDEALTEIDVNNLNGLIFDLRGNPGGLLTSVIEVTSAFQQDGVILYEEFGDGREEIFETNGTFAGITVPIAVLVNEGSASASELLAGALQDNELATIIGETTFGKGTVQTIQPLSNGGGLRLTIAKWFTPDRNSISGVGITPDIRVSIPEDFEFERDGDIQLQAAVEFIAEEAGIELINPAETE